ncbi:MAG: hypothetical protein M1604_04050, partial [Patescibacteria group bacterium]|nr:hypothetical protein [Patescibacteria group bacterium]
EVSGIWYVWSATSGNPKLIKLFTNGTGQIQGAVDLSQNIFTHGERSAEFSVAGGASTAPTLVAKVTDASSTVSYYQFTDEGFDESQPLEVDSVNLNGFPIKISQATISELGLSSGAGDISFYLSNDGVNWVAATPGNKVAFTTPTNQIFWRILLNSPGSSAQAGDQYSSPFLTKVRVEYSGTLF